jgi:hypothetical protein
MEQQIIYKYIKLGSVQLAVGKYAHECKPDVSIVPISFPILFELPLPTVSPPT